MLYRFVHLSAQLGEVPGLKVDVGIERADRAHLVIGVSRLGISAGILQHVAKLPPGGGVERKSRRDLSISPRRQIAIAIVACSVREFHQRPTLATAAEI